MNQENGAHGYTEAALDTVSQVENIKDQTREFDLPLITRFEYIAQEGRLVAYGEFEYSLQDNNRTLKVFKNVDK